MKSEKPQLTVAASSDGPKMIDVKIRRLNDLGLDEKWLQLHLQDNPELLGDMLGEDLICKGREIQQPRGGRLDLLYQDENENRRYCVEVMLGALDESHFVRAIEYWDEERTRNGSFDHVCVMIAEDIGGRFSNLFSLVARSIPLVALKLVAIETAEGVGLQLIKVLDFRNYQEDDHEEHGYEVPSTREEWQTRATKESFAAFDAINRILSELSPNIKTTYNKGHIAIGTTQNFLWHHLRSKGAWDYIELYLGAENVATAQSDLLTIGKESNKTRNGTKIKFSLTIDEVEAHRDLLINIFQKSLAAIR